LDAPTNCLAAPIHAEASGRYGYELVRCLGRQQALAFTRFVLQCASGNTKRNRRGVRIQFSAVAGPVGSEPMRVAKVQACTKRRVHVPSSKQFMQISRHKAEAPRPHRGSRQAASVLIHGLAGCRGGCGSGGRRSTGGAAGRSRFGCRRWCRAPCCSSRALGAKALPWRAAAVHSDGPRSLTRRRRSSRPRGRLGRARGRRSRSGRHRTRCPTARGSLTEGRFEHHGSRGAGAGRSGRCGGLGARAPRTARGLRSLPAGAAGR